MVPGHFMYLYCVLSVYRNTVVVDLSIILFSFVENSATIQFNSFKNSHIEDYALLQQFKTELNKD